MTQLKSIFVAMTGEFADRQALTAAFELAKRGNSGLTVAVVRPEAKDMAAQVMGALTGKSMEGFTDQIAARFAEDKEAARAVFEELRPQFPKVECCFETITGPEHRVVARHAMYHDMTVAPHPTGVYRHNFRETVSELLFRSGRPVLLVPREHGGHDVLRQVTVAWRETPEASRALVLCRPLLKMAENIHVITGVEPGQMDKPQHLEEVGEYLSLHGIEIDSKVVDVDSESYHEDMVEHAKNRESTLMVMGAVAHSSLHEVLFSTLTERMLKHDDFAVLMVG